MRFKLLVLAILLSLFQTGIAYAACPNGQVLKKVGSLSTTDAIISTTAQDVAAISVLCSGTACTAGFYNAGSFDNATNANAVIEVGAAASTVAGDGIIDFTESQLRFNGGVIFVDDGNVTAATVLSCQPQ